MADQSFFVHLQTLLDFAQELQTQLGGLGTPIEALSAQIGRASCRKECNVGCRSRWSPYH